MLMRRCSARMSETVGFFCDSLLWAIALMIFRSPIGSQLLSMVFQSGSSSIWPSWLGRLHCPWIIVYVLLRLSSRALTVYCHTFFEQAAVFQFILPGGFCSGNCGSF